MKRQALLLAFAGMLYLVAASTVAQPQSVPDPGASPPLDAQELALLRERVQKLEQRVAALEARPANPAGVKPRNDEPARVGQIFIVGNKKIDQAALMEALSLYPGQVLNFAELRSAEKRLNAIGSIKQAAVVVQDPDRQSVYKDILVTIQER